MVENSKTPNAGARDTMGTLTVVYPPQGLTIPINFPVEVWVYLSGTAAGNQPITFTPTNANITIVSADTQTDNDGFAHAIIKASGDGSLTANTTGQYSSSITLALHPDILAGGPPIEVLAAGIFNPMPAEQWLPVAFQFNYQTSTSWQTTTMFRSDHPNGVFLKERVRADPSSSSSWVTAFNLYKADSPGSAPPATFTYGILGQDFTTGWTEPPELTAATPMGTGTLSVVLDPPIEGDLLQIGVSIPFRAVFLNELGQPWKNKSLQWTKYSNAVFVSENTTQTDENGISYNYITIEPYYDEQYPIPHLGYLGFVVNGIEDNGGLVQGAWLGEFYDPINPPFWNFKVTLTPPVGELSFGLGYTVQATVLQGQGLPDQDPTDPWANATVRWYADDVSKDRVVFSRPGDLPGTVPGERFPTVTDAQGNTSIVISGLGTDPFVANIYAETVSPITGESYKNSATVVFGQIIPNIAGIAIDKPYIHNPAVWETEVNPDNKHEVIAARLILEGPYTANQGVALTSDVPIGLSVFQNGISLPLDINNSWALTSDADGLVDFLIGAVNYQVCLLTASWGEFNTATMQLAAATITGDSSSSLPEIKLVGEFFPMPEDSVAFQAYVIANSAILPDDVVAFLVNERIVYYGPAKALFYDAGKSTQGIPIAYAMMSGSTNVLTYLRRTPNGGDYTTWERKPTRQSVTGTAVTEPLDTGALAAPGIVSKDDSTIDAFDIMDGLTITIPGLATGDTVTAYVFFFGIYALDEEEISDVWTLTHTVRANNPSPLVLTVPQYRAAGYGEGQIQANYMVETKSGATLWSQVTTKVLNTTF